MRGIRVHVLAIALATMSVQIGTLAAGALRVCWGAEHRHAGPAALDCAMHHGSVPAGHHDHHGRHSPAHEAPTSQITCNCANDPGAPYVSPTAVVAHRVSLSVTLVVHPFRLENDLRIPRIDRTPLSPPPRQTRS